MGVEKSSCKGTFSIREFQGSSEDAVAASALLREARESAAWSAQSLADSLRVPGTQAYFSERDATPTGFIIARAIGDLGEILNLAVSANDRRQGQGRRLVEAVLIDFKAQGVTRVFLEVRESNAVARAFYETFGFKAAAVRKNYYADPPESAVVMERLGQKLSTD